METFQRTFSGLLLLSLLLGAIFFEQGNWILAFLLVFFFSLLGLKEYYNLLRYDDHLTIFSKTGFFFGACITLLYYIQFLELKQKQGHDLGAIYHNFISVLPSSFSALPLLLTIFFITTSIIQILSSSKGKAIFNLSATFFGPIYTTLTTVHAFLLLAMPDGKFYLLFFLFLPIATDVGGYFFGRHLGRHTLGITLSPKKTYEGYIGGLILTMLIGVGFLYFWNEIGNEKKNKINLGYLETCLLSFFMAFFAFFGDLIESAFKRDMKTKDSGRNIPGHGGILDLADTIYWSLPLGYMYLSFRSVIVDFL